MWQNFYATLCRQKCWNQELFTSKILGRIRYWEFCCFFKWPNIKNISTHLTTLPVRQKRKIDSDYLFHNGGGCVSFFIIDGVLCEQFALAIFRSDFCKCDFKRCLIISVTRRLDYFSLFGYSQQLNFAQNL